MMPGVECSAANPSRSTAQFERTNKTPGFPTAAVCQSRLRRRRSPRTHPTVSNAVPGGAGRGGGAGGAPSAAAQRQQGPAGRQAEGVGAAAAAAGGAGWVAGLGGWAGPQCHHGAPRFCHTSRAPLEDVSSCRAPPAGAPHRQPYCTPRPHPPARPGPSPAAGRAAGAAADAQPARVDGARGRGACRGQRTAGGRQRAPVAREQQPAGGQRGPLPARRGPGGAAAAAGGGGRLAATGERQPAGAGKPGGGAVAMAWRRWHALPCCCASETTPIPHLRTLLPLSHSQFDRLKIKYEEESAGFREQLEELKQQVGKQECTAGLAHTQHTHLCLLSAPGWANTCTAGPAKAGQGSS